MPATFDRELWRLLTRAGCTFVRMGKGSHEIWHNPVTLCRLGSSAAIPQMVSLYRLACRKPLEAAGALLNGAAAVGINGAGRNIARYFDPCRPRAFRASQLRCAARWRARLFSGVAGMSRWVMPSGLSASTTKFVMAASAPTL